jgi:PAS domain S-box-containing protein
MLTELSRRLPLPRSLRWQFTLALSVPALLIIACGLSAVYGWRVSSDTTRQLAEQDLEHLQQAQDLVQYALLIDHESHRMLTADSITTMQASYLATLERLDLMDSLVGHLNQASNNLEVLALNQANQLFRNTFHTVAQLRKNLLTDRLAPPESARQQETLLHFHDEMHRHVGSLVDSTHDLSVRFTRDYQETIRQLTATAVQDQVRVLALLTGSILLAGLVARYFLGRRVVGRLQQVSNCLRIEETDTGCQRVPVQGDDEIGDMARAVEQFLEDRRLLIQTQHDLRQNKEMMQAIIETTPVAIVGMDLNGNVQSVWNRAAEKMLGWSAREVMGRPFPAVPEEKKEEFIGFSQQISKGEILKGVEVSRIKRDGTPIDYSIYGSALHDAEEKINGYIAVLVDITDRKRLDDQLRRKNEDLARSNAELEQFAYVASHDLQEPLRKVGSYMELVTERYREQLDRDGIEFIDYAVDGARRMKIMIDDLLTYSRVGTRDQTFVSIDMMDVMHHVLNDLELAIRENDAVVTYDALPAVTADNSQLQQLLRNLIGNALKYRGADPPKIRISAQRQRLAWQIFVKDNGIGIETRFFERIFQIFQRLHPRDRFNGTGIGLAICKKIVERHGGTIGVQSKPGQGSTFYFTIAEHKEAV